MYLDNKRVDIDTSLPQSWVPSIALVLVNSFRLAICFSLGVAFTQTLWRNIRVAPMTIADFDRLHFVQNDLRALLHMGVLRSAPALSTMAALSWLVTIVIIFPPGSITVVSKDFTSVLKQKVQVFDGASLGNGSYGAAMEHMFTKNVGWIYL